MILKRLYDEALAQASYVVGCAATGEALVIEGRSDKWQLRPAFFKITGNIKEHTVRSSVSTERKTIGLHILKDHPELLTIHILKKGSGHFLNRSRTK